MKWFWQVSVDPSVPREIVEALLGPVRDLDEVLAEVRARQEELMAAERQAEQESE